ncbi:MAG TPA: FGGY-family carbohydrate kinase [Thermogutta sp.]|nr:FGGY-family carbohydrate kinase [Thermogutta sp.]HOP78885.1 FGGY-family carbohydrate kinase [Thermogutta sp.]HPU07769.1 FGGY-family carbohydrate kinase [Thermogutta sp.]HQF12722.1 FGGY-family carbohydrate kinase [Thermogutta sp.]
MSEALQCVKKTAVITGWDFSTGGVKCLAFDIEGHVLAEVRLPTDIWFGDSPATGIRELNVMQLEGQAYASTRAIAAELTRLGRIKDWVAGGISATHHTSARIDRLGNQVRRAICWNDATLAEYHAKGLARLGGQERVRELIGGPWAIRYGLSHLVKDEVHLSPADWRRTYRIAPHGVLAAGYLTGNFDVCSVSVGASSGIMDLRTKKWRWEMLEAIENEEYRRLVKKQLPKIIDQNTPIGPLSESVALSAGLPPRVRPLIFPTSDDQQAGLVGGGAVDAGQVAVILGNSAVVNSSSADRPQRGQLDVMRLNWGPYLWMRCYNNGAQFLDQVVGPQPNWGELEQAARNELPGCDGTLVLPFVNPEPSLGISQKDAQLRWIPQMPETMGRRFRASLEAIAYLIALAVREHEDAGQKITRITVSGGIARSNLMCEILATVLGRSLVRLESEEGPALGAAVTALAALESHLRKAKGIRKKFTVADAVAAMVRFRGTVEPNPAWAEAYRMGFERFCNELARIKE